MFLFLYIFKILYIFHRFVHTYIYIYIDLSDFLISATAPQARSGVNRGYGFAVFPCPVSYSPVQWSRILDPGSRMVVFNSY